MHSLLVFVHLIAVAVWIGGMFFAHLCLRPAAQRLEPPQRLALMSDALRLFFRWVAVAIVLLWATGLAMMLSVGFAAAPWPWHAMMGLALVMTVIFGVIAHGLHPRLRTAISSQQWPDAALVLARIRGLVTANLLLGTLTIGFAALGR